jgi:hypothetical protein
MQAALGLALGLGALAWCEQAVACSCAEPNHIVPNGTRDVPTNVKIWISEKRAQSLHVRHLRASGTAPEKRPWPEVNTSNLREAIVLRGPAGEVTELHIESLDLEELRLYFVVTPRHDLAPGNYVLDPRIPQDETSRQDWGTLGATFSVGTTRQESPPPPPSATVVRWDNDAGHGHCGDAVGASLEVSPTHWLLAYEAVDPARPDDPQRLRTGYKLASDGSVWFGSGRCTASWDFGRSSALVRFGTLDYAGKFSGFGPPLKLEAPWTPDELRGQTMAKIKALRARSEAQPRPLPGGCACRVDPREPDVYASVGLLLIVVTTTCWRRGRPCLRRGRWSRLPWAGSRRAPWSACR